MFCTWDSPKLGVNSCKGFGKDTLGHLPEGTVNGSASLDKFINGTWLLKNCWQLLLTFKNIEQDRTICVNNCLQHPSENTVLVLFGYYCGYYSGKTIFAKEKRHKPMRRAWKATLGNTNAPTWKQIWKRRRMVGRGAVQVKLLNTHRVTNTIYCSLPMTCQILDFLPHSILQS